MEELYYVYEDDLYLLPQKEIITDRKNAVGRFESVMPALQRWIYRSYVDKFYEMNESPNKVKAWCDTHNFVVSLPVHYRYYKAWKENRAKRYFLPHTIDPDNNDWERVRLGYERLHDTNLSKKPKKKKLSAEKLEKKKAEDERKRLEETKKRREQQDRAIQSFHEKDTLKNNKVKSDLEYVDAIIQKGMETLNKMEAMAPATALKAVELKHKITKGQHQSFTVYGFEEIKLREKAREEAMVKVLLHYVPREQHDDVLRDMELATRDFYKERGMENAYDQFLQSYDPDAQDDEEEDGDEEKEA